MKLATINERPIIGSLTHANGLVCLSGYNVRDEIEEYWMRCWKDEIKEISALTCQSMLSRIQPSKFYELWICL